MADEKHRPCEGSPGQSVRKASVDSGTLMERIKDADDLALAATALSGSSNGEGFMDYVDMVNKGNIQKIANGSYLEQGPFDTISIVPEPLPTEEEKLLTLPSQEKQSHQKTPQQLEQPPESPPQPQPSDAQYVGLPFGPPQLEQLTKQISNIYGDYLRVLAMGSQSAPSSAQSPTEAVESFLSAPLGSAPAIMPPIPVPLSGPVSGMKVYLLPVAIPIATSSSSSPSPSPSPSLQHQVPHTPLKSRKRKERELDEESESGSGSDTQTPGVENTARGSSPKYFICPCHAKGFTTKFSRDRHIKGQSGHRPLECQYCGKRTTTKAQMKRHIQSHTKEQPWHCPDCGKRYADRTNMERHRRQIHKWNKHQHKKQTVEYIPASPPSEMPNKMADVSPSLAPALSPSLPPAPSPSPLLSFPWSLPR